MFNKGGVTTEDLVSVRQVLADAKNFASVGAVIDNTCKDSDGKCLAGTPLYGDFRHRDGGANAFVKPTAAVSAVLGVYSLEIKTAATNGDTIVIDGVTYTKAAAESVENKEFEGSTAAAQVTSLLKMVVCDDFVVAAGATSAKIKFTQKVAREGNVPLVSSVQYPSTGAVVLGAITKTTDPVESTGSNANCVLMHDIEFVSTNDANGTVITAGTINYARLDSTVQTEYTASVIAALAANGIKVL